MAGRLEGIVGHAKHKTGPDGDEWMSVTDLMAGLMVVFLFIAIALMRNAFIERDKVSIERDKIKEVAVAYEKNQVAIYDALMNEFKDDLTKWDASITPDTLSFDFKSPDVLFATGQIELRSQFKDILNDFFPRYLQVLLTFRRSINEVRIEGHTSSIWNNKTSLDEAYFKNMRLSQGRTRSVLEYVYDLKQVTDDRDWVKRYMAAVGFSSSKLILAPDGTEDRERSRRVSFRVITNAETQIRKILED